MIRVYYAEIQSISLTLEKRKKKRKEKKKRVTTVVPLIIHEYNQAITKHAPNKVI